MGARSRAESGEGKFGLFVSLVLLAAAIYSGVKVIPVYSADWQFEDAMRASALGVPNETGNSACRKMLQRAIDDNGLAGYLSASDCTVTLAGNSRRVACSYQREVTYLPGVVRMVVFEHKVEQVVF